MKTFARNRVIDPQMRPYYFYDLEDAVGFLDNLKVVEVGLNDTWTQFVFEDGSELSIEGEF
jgi:hypothetical protein